MHWQPCLIIGLAVGTSAAWAQTPDSGRSTGDTTPVKQLQTIIASRDGFKINYGGKHSLVRITRSLSRPTNPLIRNNAGSGKS